ncbi:MULTISPECIES: GNAT family N-acetyltransferase [Rhizobium/Agrobacterium group]|uniref:Acetyltransferase n=2 Tax=Rhizobium/Agrobacterium group TaxID=227290 RepID=B9JZ41_ALLAM|nr:MULTISPECIES: GNAT family N-acetyltransferase [Rhizobium/Agrobacterium group]ACM37287.1 acetyltransferase [Allorhizobium ampelinum S4]MCF1492378.1 GNAT family N-acetyltransferase [Allorhizobium ampelinum]MUO30202.1 GNAT family N-acetyltransferase [Agrobacterium vitis]MUO45067.1 GNAT family N-acetyltransferase [Agrobacterium vitis]MUP11963.1 GNAT family N-acetyltransferase [Agrobacterium vitis]
MSETVVIRPATFDDLEALLALYKDLSSNNDFTDVERVHNTYAAILSHPGLTVFVALDRERPVATASLLITPNLTRGCRPYALIENVVSAATHRGQGYGRAVVLHAIDAAWNADCYKVMLLTGSTRPEIHHFYEACGFVQNKTGYQIRRT